MLDCESCFHLFVAIAARFSYDTGMFASHVNGMFCLSARAGMSLINLNYPSFRGFFPFIFAFSLFPAMPPAFYPGYQRFFLARSVINFWLKAKPRAAKPREKPLVRNATIYRSR